MEALQLIQLSLDDLGACIEAASKRGAAEALAEFHKATAPPIEVTKPEAMTLAGFKDPAAFSAFLKRNRIYPSGTRGKYNLYKRDEIVNAKYPKGKHI